MTFSLIPKALANPNQSLSFF